MCEPMTIIALSAAVLGGVMTAKSQKDQGDFTEAMGKRNAQTEQAKADEAIRIGAIDEERQRTQTKQIMGEQRAGMASTGLEVDSGSFGDILADTAKFGELDAQTIRANALKDAWGFKGEATNSLLQGSMAGRAGSMNAAGTLLSSASQAFGMYSRRSGFSSGKKTQIAGYDGATTTTGFSGGRYS